MPNCVCGYVCDLLLRRTNPGRSLRNLLRHCRNLRSRSPRTVNRHHCHSNIVVRLRHRLVHRHLLRASVHHIDRISYAFRGRKLHHTLRLVPETLPSLWIIRVKIGMEELSPFAICLAHLVLWNVTVYAKYFVVINKCHSLYLQLYICLLLLFISQYAKSVPNLLGTDLLI